MILFPAVDIKDGRCVRLRKGDPETAKKYFDQPWRAAAKWEKAGAKWLHLVDLDGALTQSRQNMGAVSDILQKTQLNIQMGGGIRSEQAIDRAIESGVKKVVLGTRAVQDPPWTIRQCRRLPGRIVVALDSREGQISIEGWKQRTGISVEELAERLQAGGPAAFLHTDVARDGMLSQPDFKGLKKLLRCTCIPVIASGGVSGLEDIERLGECGVDGIITGKALYEGRFQLEDALETAAKFGSRLE